MGQNSLMFQRPTGLVSPGADPKVTAQMRVPLRVQSPRTGKTYLLQWDAPEEPTTDDIEHFLSQVDKADPVPSGPPPSNFEMIWDQMRNQAGNQNMMGVPGSFGFDVLEGATGKSARPGVGAMIGNATGLGLASMTPAGRGVRIGAGLLGAILGGFGGAVSAGQSIPEAGYTGLEQGALQTMMGDAPVEIFQKFAPTAGKIANWAERNALQPFMNEKELGKMINPATGKQYDTMRESADAMARRSLDRGYESTFTGNRVGATKKAQGHNEAVRGVKVKALTNAEIGGERVNPRASFGGFPELTAKSGRSMTEYGANENAINAVGERYMNHPMLNDDFTNIIPQTQPARFQGPFPIAREDFGGKGFFGMDLPPQQVAVGQRPMQAAAMKVGITPTEADDMLRYTGNELQPQWSKELPKPEMDARMSLYSHGADELERLDPVIGEANRFMSQNIPLEATLNRATMGQAGIREGAGMHGSGRLFFNAALRPPLGATARGFNNWGQLANTPTAAQSPYFFGPRNTVPNTMRMTGADAGLISLMEAITGVNRNKLK